MVLLTVPITHLDILEFYLTKMTDDSQAGQISVAPRRSKRKTIETERYEPVEKLRSRAADTD